MPRHVLSLPAPASPRRPSRRRDGGPRLGSIALVLTSGALAAATWALPTSLEHVEPIAPGPAVSLPAVDSVVEEWGGSSTDPTLIALTVHVRSDLRHHDLVHVVGRLQPGPRLPCTQQAPRVLRCTVPPGGGRGDARTLVLEAL